ncbi:MAG TPA: hypothetical protein VHT50_05035 [Mycobacterium sp.]|nr:hypothetical protein [Mycobacterium sp.]
MITVPTRFRQLLPGTGDSAKALGSNRGEQVTLSTRRLRHLAAAGLIAAAATVSGSAIGDPATACAAPKFDSDFYRACTTQKQLLYEKGQITKKERDDALKECCELAGGTWARDPSLSDWVCQQPSADAPQTLPGGVPTQTFQPAPPPVRQPGSVNPTVTFAPAG